jgi:hypothetical protein
MPRKRKKGDAVVATPDSEIHIAEETAATATPKRPAYIDGPPTAADGHVTTEEAQPPTENPKNWGPPYKAIFTSTEKGFEMGENRRFKQRVFKFKDKPDSEIVAVLKDNGFTYRPEEKAWTIQADNATRLLSDQLAAQFAGQSRDQSR